MIVSMNPVSYTHLAVYKRQDIWWSIPSYLKDSYDAEWYAYTELDFENISLENTDKYNAAPLTLAWSLSSVNNNVRQNSRFKLTAWGISQPMEFWELFKKCISINDMQILEDMFAIAYGIALEQLAVSYTHLDVYKRQMKRCGAQSVFELMTCIFSFEAALSLALNAD